MHKLKMIFSSTRSKVLTGVALLALAVAIYMVASHFLMTSPVGGNQSSATRTSSEKTDTTPHSSSDPAKPIGAMTEHTNIIATVFWVGEDAGADNDYIQNRSSTWQEDWQGHFGGIDDPEDRCGYHPCGFTPKENPFYFALPFNDYQEDGQPRSAHLLKKIPWYTGQPKQGTSLLKNRWVKINNGDRVAYAQWEDVGPFNEDDSEYVFGTSAPKERRAGIDLSPATASYLGIDGRGPVAWQFVDETQVPTGPWKEVVTTSGLIY